MAGAIVIGIQTSYRSPTVLPLNSRGATPTMVPYKDVKGAFEDGKIDCAENNLPSFISAGHYKHAKYFFQTNHVVTPEALVVSLGFDMAGDDPLSVVGMTTDGFAAMARAIVSLDLPTVLVQEGGYLGPSLARNAEAYLTATRAALA